MSSSCVVHDPYWQTPTAQEEFRQQRAWLQDSPGGVAFDISPFASVEAYDTWLATCRCTT